MYGRCTVGELDHHHRSSESCLLRASDAASALLSLSKSNILVFWYFGVTHRFAGACCQAASGASWCCNAFALKAASCSWVAGDRGSSRLLSCARFLLLT